MANDEVHAGRRRDHATHSTTVAPEVTNSSQCRSFAATTSHLTSELFQLMAKVKLRHIPYRGSAPATQDLLAGQVDMIFDNIPGSLAQMRGDIDKWSKVIAHANIQKL